MPATSPPPLAERLKLATRDVHRVVERSGLMAALLGGRLQRQDYVALLRHLQALYAALEPALLRHAGHAGVGPVVMPALFRTEALVQDLAVLQPAPPAAGAPALVPAMADYVQRLHDLAANRPELLLAHAYVRYLGDLSGGQQLRRIVARALGLAGGAGTRFYDFGSEADVAASVRRFRAGLDAAGAAEVDQDAIVAEAHSAFERHRLVFEQLAAA